MNSQMSELLIAYGVTAASMLFTLLLLRAGGRAYWRWPVYSAMAMSLGVVLWSLVRKTLLPPEWILLHGRALYFSAIALYALLGASCGVLLARLTRGRGTSAQAPPV